MTIRALVEKLSQYDQNKFPVIGEILHLGGGIGASISKKSIGVIEIDGVVVIHEQGDIDPDLSQMKQTIITNF